MTVYSKCTIIIQICDQNLVDSLGYHIGLDLRRLIANQSKSEEIMHVSYVCHRDDKL